jgi:cytochrome c553
MKNPAGHSACLGFAFATLLCSASFSVSDEITPAERDRKNPVARSEETLRAARKLWQSHCETCHGAKGKGDGPNARLHERRKGYAPRNLTDPAVQENLTDGEIYFRISKGLVEGKNIIMPSYETKVPDEIDRWTLVLFVRELGRAGKP